MHLLKLLMDIFTKFLLSSLIKVLKIKNNVEEQKANFTLCNRLCNLLFCYDNLK